MIPFHNCAISFQVNWNGLNSLLKRESKITPKFLHRISCSRAKSLKTYLRHKFLCFLRNFGQSVKDLNWYGLSDLSPDADILKKHFSDIWEEESLRRLEQHRIASFTKRSYVRRTSYCTSSYCARTLAIKGARYLVYGQLYNVNQAKFFHTMQILAWIAQN